MQNKKNMKLILSKFLLILIIVILKSSSILGQQFFNTQFTFSDLPEFVEPIKNDTIGEKYKIKKVSIFKDFPKKEKSNLAPLFVYGKDTIISSKKKNVILNPDTSAVYKYDKKGRLIYFHNFEESIFSTIENYLSYEKDIRKIVKIDNSNSDKVPIFYTNTVIKLLNNKILKVKVNENTLTDNSTKVEEYFYDYRNCLTKISEWYVGRFSKDTTHSVIYFNYDKNCKLIEKLHFDKSKTEYFYNSDDLICEERYYNYGNCDTIAISKNVYTYNDSKLLLNKRNFYSVGEGNVFCNVYFDTKYFYNDFGLIQKHEQYNMEGKLGSRYIYEYEYFDK